MYVVTSKHITRGFCMQSRLRSIFIQVGSATIINFQAPIYPLAVRSASEISGMKRGLRTRTLHDDVARMCLPVIEQKFNDGLPGRPKRVGVRGG